MNSFARFGNLLVTVLLIADIPSSSAQFPMLKAWDHRYGGSSTDFVYSFVQLPDGGYALGGVSSSDAGGDKSQNNFGATDYWVVGLDGSGSKRWDQGFGGDQEECLYSICATSDGGLLLAGYSASGISGNKSVPLWGTIGSDADYWIVKIDSMGNKQWEKDYGGTDLDILTSAEETSDRGFILGGASLSGISGNRTEASRGSMDYWIVKTDSLGNLEWDKRFGGGDEDKLTCVRQTQDGGYFLGGYSYSDSSGDKTQDNWNAAFHSRDFWVVKTDSAGNKQWDRRYGSESNDWLCSAVQSEDGGYLVSGWTQTLAVNGDLTQPVRGGGDYLVFKLDPMGTLQWDRIYGGSGNDEYQFGSLARTLDGGYLLAATSYSDSSGDKTENNLSIEHSWIVKIDSTGNKQWDKTLQTNSPIHDEIGLAMQAADGCYVMVNSTAGGMAGDKSQVSQGGEDYWIIKFCDPVQADFSSVRNLCPGTCTDFINLSVNGTAYQWSFPGASPDTSTAFNPTGICYLTPGSYDVTLIATNFNIRDTITLAGFINVHPYSPSQSILQSGDTLISNAGFVSYQWFYFGDTIAGATNHFYLAPTDGDYSVVCLDSNGCSVEAVLQNVLTSLPEEGSRQQLVVYPNPAWDQFVVSPSATLRAGSSEFVENPAAIYIYNLLGERFPAVLLRTTSNELRTIDILFLPPGTYFIELTAPNGTFRARFIKQ